MNEFQKQNDEALKQMNTRQKIRYFMDYYFLKVLVVLLAAGVVIYMAWSYLKPKEEYLIYAAVLDANLDAAAAADLQNKLAENAGGNAKAEDFVFDDGFRSYMQEDMVRLSVASQAMEVDCVIADEEMFTELAGYGYFIPLSEVLTEEQMAEFEGKILERPGRAEGESDTLEDEQSGRGEVLPYGISLEDSSLWKESLSEAYGSTKEGSDGEYHPVFGFTLGSPHPENAALLAELLL